MPLYDIRCNACGDIQSIFRLVSLRDNLPDCVCEGTFSRVLSAPMVQVEISPYKSPGTGRMISSRSEMKEDLKRSGAIMYEPGMREQIARRKAEVATDSFKPIEAAVDNTVKNLISSGILPNA